METTASDYPPPPPPFPSFPSSRSSSSERIKKSDEKMTTEISTKSKRHEPTCRLCYSSFSRETNNPKACKYHPESYCGETAQRWMDPGETKGGGEIHNFYSCCGGNIESKGCCYSAHYSFDEPEENFSFRRPGMGVDPEL